MTSPITSDDEYFDYNANTISPAAADVSGMEVHSISTYESNIRDTQRVLAYRHAIMDMTDMAGKIVLDMRYTAQQAFLLGI